MLKKRNYEEKIARQVYKKGETPQSILYDPIEKIGKVITSSGYEMPVYKGRLIGTKFDKVYWNQKDKCIFCNTFAGYSNGKKEVYYMKGKKAVNVNSQDYSKLVESLRDPLPMKLTRIGTGATMMAINIAAAGLSITQPDVFPPQHAIILPFGTFYLSLLPIYMLSKYFEECEESDIEKIIERG